MTGEIFCFVDESLPENLVAVVKRTIRDAGIIYHNTPAIFADPSQLHGMKGSDFTKAGTIIRISGYGIQRDAGRIIGKIFECLRKNDRRITFITMDDLTCILKDEYLNFCFGFAQGHSNVISMARFKSEPPRVQEIILAGLIMHELGHTYNVAADERRENTEYNLGMHCTSDFCVMRQTLTAQEIKNSYLSTERHLRHMSDVGLRYYCPLCMKDIDKYFWFEKETISNSTSSLPPRRSALEKSTVPLPPRRSALKKSTVPLVPRRIQS